MTMNTDAEPALYHQNPPPHRANRSRLAAADTTLEFGHFRVLLRQRRLVADGVRIDARLLAKTATLSAQNSAAATGSMPQFAPPSPGLLVDARRDGGTGQIKGRFPVSVARLLHSEVTLADSCCGRNDEMPAVV